MLRLLKLTLLMLGRGLTFGLFAFLAGLGQAAAGSITTSHSDGVSASAGWFDPTNQLDVFFMVNANGGGYSLFYSVQSASLSYGGSGAIPSSSVTFSGGSLKTGKMVVSISVDTCQLDPTVFTTTGPCGIVSLTFKQTAPNPGFPITIINGTVENIFGSVTAHLSGTMQSGPATLQGTVIGFPTTPDTFFVSVGLNHNVTVVTQTP